MKKLISLILVLVMVLGLLAACNDATADPTQATNPNDPTGATAAPTIPPEAELEPLTLRFIYDGAEGPKSGDVLEVFNKKLSEIIPNTTVEIVWVADFKANWPMMLAAGDVMDLAWVGWKNNMLQDALDGSYTPLNDLVAEYGPNIAKESEIWVQDYKSGMLDGELYMLPCVQPTVSDSQCFWYGDFIAPYFDADAMVNELRNNIHATERMWELMEEAIEAAIADGAIQVGKDDWFVSATNMISMGNFGYKGVTGDMWVSIDDPEMTKLYHLWEIPEVKFAMERMAQWYEKGWITENNLLGQLPEGAKELFSPSAAWNQNWGMATDDKGTYTNETSTTARADGQAITYILANYPEQNTQGVSSFGAISTYIAIPYTAQDPARSMMVLNLLHDEVGTPGNDLYNLLCYGFEKNSPEAKEYGWYGYEAIEKDGQLVRSDYTGENHAMVNWKLGNTYKIISDDTAMLTVASKEYCMKFYTESYPKMAETPMSRANKVIYYSDFNDQADAVKAVKVEYQALLHGGSVGTANFEKVYEEALTKVYEAGFDKIKAYAEEQLEILRTEYPPTK